MTLRKNKMIVKKLSKREEDTLARHSEHHTKKHMTYMRTRMSQGDTFTNAHKKAIKKVGR
tara:strand:+ start:329 stop:508 length:180 start_codon:yes stop_codon:yes gene_type:complete